MKNFRESLKEELKNPEFKKEWEALDTEFRLLRQSLNQNSDDFRPRNPRADVQIFGEFGVVKI